MKKSLWIFGVAVIALTGCTNNEVVDIPQSRAINFSNTFVNNATRADVTNANFTQFWVYGGYQNGASWVDVFNNVKVSGASVGSGAVWTPEETAYWQVNKTYNFGAYADGTSQLTTGISYEPASKTLTFSDYSAGANDLIAATSSDVSWDGSADPAKVQLSFNHMLSKVKFTFKTDAVETYTMKVSGLKISQAIQTATGTMVNNVVGTWSGDKTGEYSFADIDDYATAEGQAESEVKYVIPQEGTNEIRVDFTVTVTDGGDYSETGSFSGTMAIADANKWEPGLAYNYTVTINPDKVDDTLKPILFDVTTVTDWEEFTNPDLSVN